mmetsp:Transcript_91720/g.218533  ORF Transcript_91720/g.218533 Transcript_91720/m.218533 type:complete len:286 (-) Transcript_91720:383-1240(-)
MRHLDHRGTFAVGDRVKDFLDLFGVVDGHLDGMGAPQAVKSHGCSLRVGGELVPHREIGEDLVSHVVFTPGGEPLVEPEVVPPHHGNQIPEPLVCQLMRHHNADALHLVSGGSLADEQIDLAVCDQPPILHRPCRKLRDRNHVKLGQRVREAKVVIVAVKRLRGYLERKFAILHPAWRSEDSHQDAMLRLGLDKVEFANHEGQKVSGHLWRVHEANFNLRPRIHKLPALLRHVAQGRESCIHYQGKPKNCLAGRLIPARESPASIQGLKLRRRHDLGHAVDVFVA